MTTSEYEGRQVHVSIIDGALLVYIDFNPTVYELNIDVESIDRED